MSQRFATSGREVADPVSILRLIGPVHESDRRIEVSKIPYIPYIPLLQYH